MIEIQYNDKQHGPIENGALMHPHSKLKTLLPLPFTVLTFSKHRPYANTIPFIHTQTSRCNAYQTTSSPHEWTYICQKPFSKIQHKAINSDSPSGIYRRRYTCMASLAPYIYSVKIAKSTVTLVQCLDSINLVEKKSFKFFPETRRLSAVCTQL